MSIYRGITTFMAAFAMSGMACAQTAMSIDQILAIARERYVKIETHTMTTIASDGARTYQKTANAQATGFRIGGKYVITDFHVMTAGDRCTIDGKPVTYVKIAPDLDLALFTMNFPNELPWIRIADANIGHTVYVFSNADGQDGFFMRFFVSKLDGQFLYLQERTVGGTSGSGYLDEWGNLVGLAMQDMFSDNGGTHSHFLYAEGIPASVLRAFLRGIVPEDAERSADAPR